MSHPILQSLPQADCPYLYFYNKEPLDPVAIETFGLNAKPTADAFGTFGTGMKHGIAWLAGRGYSVHFYSKRMMPEYQFTGVTQMTFRGQPTKQIALFGWNNTRLKVLPFTDNLAKAWQPWMIFREFRCNATDEGGSWTTLPEEIPEDSGTVIAIACPELNDIAARVDQFFLTTPLRWRLGAFDIHEGESDFIYYRGVACYKLDKPSLHTYNIQHPQPLTEDRTLQSIGPWHYYLGTFLTQSENEDFLDWWYNTYTEAKGDHFEDKLDMDYVPKVSCSPQALRYLTNGKIALPPALSLWFKGTDSYGEATRPQTFNDDQLSFLLKEIAPLLTSLDESLLQWEPGNPLARTRVSYAEDSLRLSPRAFMLDKFQLAGLIYAVATAKRLGEPLGSEDHLMILGESLLRERCIS